MLEHLLRKGRVRAAGEELGDNRFIEGGDEGKHRSSQQREPDLRQGDRPECHGRGRAEGLSHAFEIGVAGLDAGRDRKDDEGQGKRQMSDDDAGRVLTRPSGAKSMNSPAPVKAAGTMTGASSRALSNDHPRPDFLKARTLASIVPKAVARHIVMRAARSDIPSAASHSREVKKLRYQTRP